jgi:DNA-binding CsgD family transcriptional regulator
VLGRLDRFAEVAGDTPGERQVLSQLTMQLWYRGARPAVEVADVARRAFRDGLLVDESNCQQLAWAAAVGGLVFTDSVPEAWAALEHAGQYSRARGWADGLMANSMLRCLLHLRTGQLDSVQEEGQAALDWLAHFERTPMRMTGAANIVSYLVEVAVERGDADSGELLVHTHGFSGALPNDIHTGTTRFRRALLRLLQNRTRDAIEDLEAQREIERRAAISNPTLAWRCVAARAHHHLGDQMQAIELAEEQLQIARRWGLARDLGIALITRGAIDTGAPQIDHLREAAAILEQSPSVLEHGRALVELGAALRRQGQRQEAREPLLQGAQIAQRCGASALAQRAIAELKVLGARPRRLAFSGIDSLTASERRIAELAAKQATNREIAQTLYLSVRTVENTLRRAYQKLGIKTRDQLPRILAADD